MQAQRERNYIYVLDCTKSMTGFKGSPNIWKPTKSYLKNELEEHTPSTSLHVIPFQETVLPCFNFNAEDFNAKKWKEIEEKIDEYVEKPTNTNICAAWEATGRYIDKHMDNYIILLTDGEDNVNPKGSVARKLSAWCGKYPNTYAFYVLLTKNAVDEDVVKIIKICPNEFLVDATKKIPVFGAFDNGLVIYANTLNLDRVHKISFSAVGKYAAKVVCTDPYFDVKMIGNKIENGRAAVQIIAKQPIPQINAALPETYNFSFDVQSDDVNIFNPTIKVQMTNKSERALEMIPEDSDMGKATWYDSFLFWGASDPDTLSVDLKALFNEEAQKDGSSVQLQIKDDDGKNDFKLLYNNHIVENGKITINSKDNLQSILSIVFNPKAQEGYRYLTIEAINKQELDNINGQPVEQYKLTLRSKYVEKWNPLKIILMWLCILILAALILWFLIVKHFIYPSIGVKIIQINDPYFSKVNVKGKRRVVFTNKSMRQSLLSRIFTGEILYKKNEIWTSPLTFEAGAKKKTLRVVRTKDYVIDPYTSTLKAPNDFIVENTNDNTKIKISIN